MAHLQGRHAQPHANVRLATRFTALDAFGVGLLATVHVRVAEANQGLPARRVAVGGGRFFEHTFRMGNC